MNMRVYTCGFSMCVRVYKKFLFGRTNVLRWREMMKKKHQDHPDVWPLFYAFLLLNDSLLKCIKFMMCPRN